MPDDKVKTVPVYVHNVFLIKHVMDDKEHSDGLYVVGTFIQNAFRGNSIESSFATKTVDSGESTTLQSMASTSNASVLFKDDIPGPIRFAYRFNDKTADERNGAVELRRSQIHETRDLGKLHRHTFQVKAPLELDVEFNAFPFKVVSANLTIELSSFTTQDKKTIIRPNLIVHKHEKRIMFGIQKDFTRPGTNPSKKLPFFRSKESALIRQANDKIDKSYVYDFVSPFPNVTYLYDTEKKYCPKYLVTFLLVEDGMKKFIEIVFPMILIAALNHLNVRNATKAAANPDTEPVHAVDYLNNSATFALAVVVFLPTMIGSSQFHSVFTANNLYIMTIFAALALSALPVEVVDSTTPAQIGTFLFWASFSFPVVNGFRFLKFISMHQSMKAEYFMEDAITQKLSRPSKFKPSVEKNVLDEFIPVGELVELDESRLAAMEYKKGERGNKFKIIEFASKSEGVVVE
jgi:hypothetical protein